MLQHQGTTAPSAGLSTIVIVGSFHPSTSRSASQSAVKPTNLAKRRRRVARRTRLEYGRLAIPTVVVFTTEKMHGPQGP
uniref:Secreted protein n=1 Tax=Echinococcus granulosus TaxID=6210 RepID=A0A068X5C5_ECHGR|nr:hypothetical protein EgrG_002062500 [Echinococcus granulosus]